MQDDSSELSFCPSFNIYSSDNNKLVDIAATVGRDCKSDGVFDDEEFEFVSNLCESPETSSSFPIFNRDLLLNREEGDDDDDDDGVGEAIRIPLRNLFICDGDLRSSSSSSSEADELEGIPADTYCVWKPKQSTESSPNRCKKSKSTGSSSSNRWRLIKDLLKRSNSDSKVSSNSSFLFLNTIEKKNEEKVSAKTAKTTNKKTSEGEIARPTKMKRAEKASANTGFYLTNKALKEGDKRRSYLPYRRDLVGIFANVHGLGRTFPSF